MNPRGRRPKKAGTVSGTVVVVPSPDEEKDDDSPLSPEQQAELDRLTTELRTDGVEARIYRSHPQTGNREVITDVVASNMVSLDFLRDTYGGGRYRVAFYGPTKNGKGKTTKGKVKEETFEVDTSIPPTHPRAKSGPISNGPAPAPNAGRLDSIMESGLINFLQSMQTSQQMQAAIVKQMLEGSQHKGPGVLEIIAAIAPIVAPLLTALVQRKDPMDTAREIAKLATEEKSGSNVEHFRAMLSLVKELKGIARPVVEGGESEPSWLQAIERVGVPLLERAMMQDRVAAAATSLPPTAPNANVVPNTVPTHEEDTPLLRAPNGGSPFAPATPNENPVADMLPAELSVLRPFVPLVVQWATQGRDPTWCAAAIAYDVPEGLWPHMARMLARPTIAADITGAVPALAPFEGWLAELRDELLREITGEGEDEGDENDVNPTSNPTRVDEPEPVPPRRTTKRG